MWVKTAGGATTYGGFDSFSYDVTGLLNRGGANTIVVSVWDPPTTAPQAVGKQRLNDVTPHPGRCIFYHGRLRHLARRVVEPTSAGHITRLRHGARPHQQPAQGDRAGSRRRCGTRPA
ncbi:hypothetical protein GCM10023238_22720 [Streptomyces heliomycini]